MKTKQEMQLALNDLRQVCKHHGIVLMPGPDTENGGSEIMLVEAADIASIDPHCIYFEGKVEPSYLLLTNKVIDHLNRTVEGEKALDRFTVKGIGDVKGHTKERIVVSQYAPDLLDGHTRPEACDVDSIDEIEDIAFIKHFKEQPGFVRFEIGLEDGPFGTMLACFTDHHPVTIGFIEGLSAEELKAKWPGVNDGGV